MIHSATKNLAEHGDKVDAALKEEVEKALAEAKGVASDADLDVVKSKFDALNAAVMKIGTAAYAKSNAAANQSQTPPENKDDAKDAEYDEKTKK
jgi:molecular chaperone DnaK